MKIGASIRSKAQMLPDAFFGTKIAGLGFVEGYFVIGED